MIIFRLTITIFGLFLLWQIVVWTTGVPHYILPSPLRVSESWWNHKHLILNHSLITFLEIILGLIFGTFLGLFSALLIIWSRNLRRWLLPLLVISQAIPVFAIAPLLVLWFGYGISSKIAMATLIIYFPVAASLFDGLRRTNTGWLDLAYSMEATHWTILKNIRLPAAMPSFASGIRVATAVAPIGAVVGEWVGSSAGLGYLMLHANGRMQIDLMFAALLTLAVFAVILYFTIDFILRRSITWQPDSLLESYKD